MLAPAVPPQAVAQRTESAAVLAEMNRIRQLPVIRAAEKHYEAIMRHTAGRSGSALACHLQATLAALGERSFARLASFDFKQ
jgi:hypothetical protein